MPSFKQEKSATAAAETVFRGDASAVTSAINPAGSTLNSSDLNPAANPTIWLVLGAVSICHLLNDMMQSLIPAAYPILKQAYHLSFGQIGIVTFAYQISASLLQPIVGMITDARPKPYSLPVGMLFTLAGLITLAYATNFAVVVLAACCVGIGSAIFHPESSRLARLASGGRHGLAQSIFQVGGNVGSAIGPLLAAMILVPCGQSGLAYFGSAAVVGAVILFNLSRWYKRQHPSSRKAASVAQPLDLRRVLLPLSILGVLVFSKYFYLASLTSYYTFYLISKFSISVQLAQVYLFVFLAAVAVGTIAGGPIGDKVGRKTVIWCSILGVLPFTLLLPYANLFWTVVLTIPIGLIIASAFSAILVYAQDLMPGRVGTVSGLFFGFAFGMGGIGAALLGQIADRYGINCVYYICSFLPALGMLAQFLPELHRSTKE